MILCCFRFPGEILKGTRPGKELSITLEPGVLMEGSMGSMKPAAFWERHGETSLRGLLNPTESKKQGNGYGKPNLHPHRTGKLKTLAASTVTYMK